MLPVLYFLGQIQHCSRDMVRVQRLLETIKEHFGLLQFNLNTVQFLPPVPLARDEARVFICEACLEMLFLKSLILIRRQFNVSSHSSSEVSRAVAD